MVKFNLLEETDSCVRYEYYPEGTTDAGIIFFNKQTNECIIEKTSKTYPRQKHALKMMAQILKYAKDNSFPEMGCVMWY